MKAAQILDLGNATYSEALAVQKQTLEEVLSGGTNTLIFVEHDRVLTLGASFHEKNLLLSADQYEQRGVEIVKTDRGGDVTFHGPGQLVIYPIFDTALCGRDLHKWLRGLEETMIRTCAAFGIEAYRFPPHTGAWTNDLKIAAIGVKIRRWVSMHGIALNCDADLNPFDWIVPCGIQNYGVTSLSQELGTDVTIEETKPVVIQAFADVFQLEFS